MRNIAILDTSALLSLYELKLLSFLIYSYNLVLIPRAVEREFLTNPKDFIIKAEREKFLLEFYNKNSSWFKQCNEYGSDTVKIYTADKKMNKGEAEVLAQNQNFDSSCVLIIDESYARKKAKGYNFMIKGVLALIAEFEIKYNFCDYRTSVNLLKNKLKSWFSDDIIELVYNKVKNEYNL